MGKHVLDLTTLASSTQKYDTCAYKYLAGFVVGRVVVSDLSGFASRRVEFFRKEVLRVFYFTIIVLINDCSWHARIGKYSLWYIGLMM